MDRILHRLEILATGMSSRELTACVRAGVIARIGRGYYTPGAVLGLPDPRGITRSVRGVLSFQSAAAWLNAALLAPVDRMHVTVPRNRGRRRDAVPLVQLHRGDLAPEEVITVNGVRVTSPLRTIIDIARSSPLAEAVVVADSLTGKGWLGISELRDCVARMPAGPGRTAARRVAGLVDPRSESAFESVTRVGIALAGLPMPQSQINIHSTDGTWLARVDFAWPDQRVILECDGWEFHSSREAFESDRRRWNALTRAGWRVFVVSWHDVIHNPTYLADLLGEVLAV